MPGPILTKFRLWRESGKGFKSRFSNSLHDAVVKRPDVPTATVTGSIDRGDRLQTWRLKHYPSIDVEFDKLYAGEVEATLEEAEDKLNDIGFRNNPTAYVEVTDEYGPDDGSYSRQIVTETGVRFDIPTVYGTPSFFRRVKDQIHVTVFRIEDERIAFLAHREKSAWMQPMRHVFVSDASARRGIRDLRDAWYDQHGEELPGKADVHWEIDH